MRKIPQQSKYNLRCCSEGTQVSHAHIVFSILVEQEAEKDAEALDAIMESALLAKAGAIAPSSKLGATPHKQRVRMLPFFAFSYAS